MLNGIVFHGDWYEVKENDHRRDCNECGIKNICCSCFATCVAVQMGRTGFLDKRYFHFERKPIEAVEVVDIGQPIRQEMKERFIEMIYEMIDSGLIEGVGDIEKVKDKIMEL